MSTIVMSLYPWATSYIEFSVSRNKTRKDIVLLGYIYSIFQSIRRLQSVWGNKNFSYIIFERRLKFLVKIILIFSIKGFVFSLSSSTVQCLQVLFLYGLKQLHLYWNKSSLFNCHNKNPEGQKQHYYEVWRNMNGGKYIGYLKFTFVI